MSVNIWIWKATNDSDSKRKQRGFLKPSETDSEMRVWNICVSLWVSESDALWLGTSPCLSDLASSHVLVIVCDGWGVCGPPGVTPSLSPHTTHHTYGDESSSRVPVMKGRRALRHSEVWQLSANLYRLTHSFPWSLSPSQTDSSQCLWYLEKSFSVTWYNYSGLILKG